MNDEERAQEIRLIREEQGILRRQMMLLEKRVRDLVENDAVSVWQARTSVPPARETLSVPAPEPETEIPPPLPTALTVAEVLPVLPTPTAATSATGAAAEEGELPSTPAPREKASLEVEIGTVWLVRIGVVFMLATLAFLVAYLYQHVVPHLGALAKVVLLYLAAGGLTGIGAFLEQKQEETSDPAAPPARHGLRQYAQVVLAGGLAAIYYVTYAAHWNPRLCIIPNPYLAGVLLLAWTAFMVFLADRRRSETLATFAILLAYYTSAINEIAGFTLVANLALAAGVVFLLRRHLWKVFPFASLLATFGSYGFWRYFHVYSTWSGRQEFPSAATGSGGFWIEGTFLAIYWLLFTWTVFAPGKKALAATAESTFAGLNNGLFFGLSTWVLLADYPGSFWKWALTFGTILLVLGEIGRRLPVALNPRTEGTYQAGGLLLVTWGLLVYFGGWHLSLALAVESTALTLAARHRRSWLIQSAAGIVACLALGRVLDGWEKMGTPQGEPWIISLSEGALLIFNAWWCRADRADEIGEDWFYGVVRLTRAAFSVIGSWIWFGATSAYFQQGASIGMALVAAAVGLTALAQGLRLGTLAFCAQGYLVLAVAMWEGRNGMSVYKGSLLHFSPVVMTGGIVAIGHWWQGRCWKTFLPAFPRNPPAILDALLAVYVLARWLRPGRVYQADVWIAESAALALLLFAYGLATGYPALAAAGQYFQLASVLSFVSLCLAGGWAGNPTELLLTLSPIVGAAVVLVALERWPVVSVSLATPRARLVVAVAYEAVMIFLLMVWGYRYFPFIGKFSLFCLFGGMIFALAVWKERQRWLGWSAMLTFFAPVLFLADYNTLEKAALVHLFGIGVIASQQQLGRRRLSREIFPFKAQVVLMLTATLVGWIWTSAFILRVSPGGTFTLAVGWSLFAVVVFAAGFVWRESTYRWLGLAILACTLGHIVLFDIWQLDSLGRIISSFALGAVLLGIAFAYIRFQRQLKKWF